MVDLNIMERRNLIYAIYDNREPERVRYVGKTTTNLKTRLSNHWTFARNAPRPYRIQAWLRSRLTCPEVVGIRVIVETETPLELNELEVQWISHYRNLGQADLNLTDGGDGGTGVVRSAESKRAISEKYRASGGPVAKLTWDQVREIRSLRQREYLEAAEVCEKYGVQRTVIDRILNNLLWADPEFDPQTIKPRPPGSSKNAKLSMGQVREMRSLRQQEWISSRVLAERHGLVEATVQHILENRSYRDPEYDPATLAPRKSKQFDNPLSGRGQLKREQVRELKARHRQGEKIVPLATEYGITSGHLRNILRGKSWSNVE